MYFWLSWLKIKPSMALRWLRMATSWTQDPPLELSWGILELWDLLEAIWPTTYYLLPWTILKASRAICNPYRKMQYILHFLIRHGKSNVQSWLPSYSIQSRCGLTYWAIWSHHMPYIYQHTASKGHFQHILRQLIDLYTADFGHIGKSPFYLAKWPTIFLWYPRISTFNSVAVPLGED